MNRRNTELFLLIIAAVIVLIMYGSLVITSGLNLDAYTLSIPIGIVVSFLIAHLAIRKLAPNADSCILPIVLVLCGIGITFITRLAPELAVKQVLWLFAGVVCMIIVLIVVKKLAKISNYKYTLMILGFLLLGSPLIPFFGQEIYGSRIWLSLGPFSFQPGEIAKVVIVLFLAGYLAYNREMLSIFTFKLGPFNLPDFFTLLPMLLMWLISILIVVFEKDLGSALVFFFVFVTMLYVSSGKKFYIIISFVLAALAAAFLFGFFTHVQQRVDVWLNPFGDPSGSGYQIVQSLYSFADGGLTGTGLGQGLSSQIPVVESDFIFVAICEELGLLGGAAVLLLYLTFAIRGFLSAARAKNDVSSFAAVGLTTIIVLQAFIIVGGITTLIPLTGLTLPFVSQGGSSLLAGFISVGFILRCGDEGTGIEKEMKAQEILVSNGVLGRVSLGKRLTTTLLIFSLLFVVLVANLTYIMIIQSDDIKHMSSNNHSLIKDQYNKRGNIETKDGTILATSVKQSDGTYDREYPAGSLASHIVGYASNKYGTSGIEQSFNDSLKGDKDFANWQDVLNNMMNKNKVGNDITLSIDKDVQKAAEQTLVGRRGACVVIDSGTGAVMASASSPTYNAGDVEGILGGTIKAEDSAMYNRATQALYAPGSTFKIVSLASALSENAFNEKSMFNSPGEMDLGGGKITSFNKIGYGYISLAKATEVSSNTVFAQVGEKLGAQKLVSYSQRFLFNNDIQFDIPLKKSLMPDPDEMTNWETAWAAAGEPVGTHNSPAGPQATVVQMALVGCAIANNGIINKPYIVDNIRNVSGDMSYSASKTAIANPISEDISKRVAKVLEGVIKQGTGVDAAIPGLNIAAKTGTAEKGGDKTDSWIVCFKNTDEGGSAVVALVLEDSNDAPAKVKNVLKTALEKQGKLK